MTTSADTHDATSIQCRRVQSVLDTVGRRWSGAIMVAAHRGARRFSDYRRSIDGISDRMLTVRLKELESLGLLRRQVIPSTPVQVIYEPTDRGLDLLRVLEPLFRWGERHLATK
ncbi:transcriptional regulator [Micromonospora qiuiae]|uniref:Transcriptional regulator n=1 Tax=Micromonospora qiuiae TaxID=502268 RepID=A0ABQ4JJF6_9ACTN|nr:helix-turn-helix domain-containing protein [Micromonospora qiuiae]GIJ29595.1 transcriptional regulator [Micromonospora qiuiae]